MFAQFSAPSLACLEYLDQMSYKTIVQSEHGLGTFSEIVICFSPQKYPSLNSGGFHSFQGTLYNSATPCFVASSYLFLPLSHAQLKASLDTVFPFLLEGLHSFS